MGFHLWNAGINKVWNFKIIWVLENRWKAGMVVEVGNEVFANIRGQVSILLLFFSFKIILTFLCLNMVYLFDNKTWLLYLFLSIGLSFSRGLLFNFLNCVPIRFLSKSWKLLILWKIIDIVVGLVRERNKRKH